MSSVRVEAPAVVITRLLIDDRTGARVAIALEDPRVSVSASLSEGGAVVELASDCAEASVRPHPPSTTKIAVLRRLSRLPLLDLSCSSASVALGLSLLALERGPLSRLAEVEQRLGAELAPIFGGVVLGGLNLYAEVSGRLVLLSHTPPPERARVLLASLPLPALEPSPELGEVALALAGYARSLWLEDEASASEFASASIKALSGWLPRELADTLSRGGFAAVPSTSGRLLMIASESSGELGELYAWLLERSGELFSTRVGRRGLVVSRRGAPRI
ncbi:MAG: hypothetical protein QXU97_05210 [Fervidicoccaceae archaeon]